MNRIIQISASVLLASAAVLGAGCSKRDDATSAGPAATPGATTTTPSTTDSPAMAPAAPASAASQ